jgi:glycosyltransferase involved in cell wall biosynthesis
MPGSQNKGEAMKAAIWANSPSPHQADFYSALRRRGIDLRVLYLDHLCESRRALGWTEPAHLPAVEAILPSGVDPLGGLADWRERVHIIPGYSRCEHRRLAARFADAGVPWAHWSECSRPVWRAWVTWPIKRWYAAMVNRSALGAFGQGVLAVRDFRRWGIRPEKISHLYYSIGGVSNTTPADRATAAFANGRTAFVFVGALSHRKACDVLLRAFAQVRASRCSAGQPPVLVLVGDGPQAREYHRLAARLQLAGSVLFRGSLPLAVIGSVLCCCQVLVLPSRFDGWGCALNEGASAGLALVATDQCGAAYHILQPGLNGYRVRAGSPSSLAAAMQVYARSPHVAALHGAQSLLRYDEFTPDANVARFISSVQAWLAASERWARWQDSWSAPSTPHAADAVA